MQYSVIDFFKRRLPKMVPITAPAIPYRIIGVLADFQNSPSPTYTDILIMSTAKAMAAPVAIKAFFVFNNRAQEQGTQCTLMPTQSSKKAA